MLPGCWMARGEREEGRRGASVHPMGDERVAADGAESHANLLRQSHGTLQTERPLFLSFSFFFCSDWTPSGLPRLRPLPPSLPVVTCAAGFLFVSGGGGANRLPRSRSSSRLFTSHRKPES